MMFPFIRCYRTGIPVPPHSFFLLSKGDNAGRPSEQPWDNCFMISCAHAGYFDYFFWLCYGLWSSGSFKAHHHGTAIQFINIGDVRQIIQEVAQPIHEHWKEYREILSVLEKLEERKATLTEQIAATRKLQDCLIHRYLSRRNK